MVEQSNLIWHQCQDIDKNTMVVAMFVCIEHIDTCKQLQSLYSSKIFLLRKVEYTTSFSKQDDNMLVVNGT